MPEFFIIIIIAVISIIIYNIDSKITYTNCFFRCYSANHIL